MIKESTYKKIKDIEDKYGSLVKALEENKIEKHTYYRWRKISTTKEYYKFYETNKIV